ncbi:MAG: hypothetical protein ACXVRV_02150 [Gaiellaceae bacterium]
MRRSTVSRLVGFTLLVALSTATAALATATTSPPPTLHLGGTWAGAYSGAFAGKFTLTWKQSPQGALTGSISLSNPNGKYGITGRVRRSTINFGVVGAGATYTGSATAFKMSGTFMTPRGGGSWSAHKLLTVVKLK